MAQYGILVDYEWCTGCHSCEFACQMEHGYPVGKTGIKVLSDGPWKIDGKRWNWNHFPVLTDLCDLCAKRMAEGGAEPTCVKHCQAKCLSFGTIEELGKQMASKRKQTLYAL